MSAYLPLIEYDYTMSEEVKPYSQEESKKKQIERMFDNIAPYYDFLNRLLSLGIDTVWRKKALLKLRGMQLDTVLDVATGTGDLALEIEKQLQPAKIIGLDLSQDMLDVGIKKIEKRGLSDKISMIKGDSENLPFENDSIDAITVAFGVRNFENLRKGLAEMHRVLKPGGKMVVLEFSRPTIFPFKQAFNFYFKNILPAVGKFTSKDEKAYEYLYESVQAFPDGKQFVSILHEIGFSNTSFDPLTLGICSIYLGQK